MSKETPIDQWERWFLKHRADEIAVLAMESIRVLLRNGSMTAEDVHHIPVKNPSVRGELMKLLRRMGIAEKTALAFGETKQSHGHTMFKWTLVNAQRARELQQKGIALVLPHQEPGKEIQTEML